MTISDKEKERKVFAKGIEKVSLLVFCIKTATLGIVGHGHNAGLLGSHISLGGLTGTTSDAATTGGHCRSMSGLSSLSLGPGAIAAAPLPPPPIFNPCSSNSLNSMSIQGPSTSRWGPRTSCPVSSNNNSITNSYD
uniref:Uncharacterized protein n=1 Tax=Glossina pallidipes TaxID=7398 RepID=A0A1A9ZEB8_GLOPL